MTIVSAHAFDRWLPDHILLALTVVPPRLLDFAHAVIEAGGVVDTISFDSPPVMGRRVGRKPPRGKNGVFMASIKSAEELAQYIPMRREWVGDEQSYGWAWFVDFDGGK